MQTIRFPLFLLLATAGQVVLAGEWKVAKSQPPDAEQLPSNQQPRRAIASPQRPADAEQLPAAPRKQPPEADQTLPAPRREILPSPQQGDPTQLPAVPRKLPPLPDPSPVPKSTPRAYQPAEQYQEVYAPPPTRRVIERVYEEELPVERITTRYMTREVPVAVREAPIVPVTYITQPRVIMQRYAVVPIPSEEITLTNAQFAVSQQPSFRIVANPPLDPGLGVTLPALPSSQGFDLNSLAGLVPGLGATVNASVNAAAVPPPCRGPIRRTREAVRDAIKSWGR